MTRIIALDFDGVVWNSVDEAFEMAWRAWSQLHGEPALDKDRAREWFRAARWQCKDGHDFYVVMRFLAQDPPRRLDGEPVAAFRRLRKEWTRSDEAERFVAIFYDERSRMRREDFDGWMALQHPFPGVADEIRAMRERTRAVAIATTKDGPSAERLLATIGISGLAIFGREVSLDKAVHMRAMAKRFAAPMGTITFVDDLLENLTPLRPLGVGLALADWGYNTVAERERARAEGVRVVSLHGLADALT